MVLARRSRPLIRAILFIVRLRRDVQEEHRRRTTRRRMGGGALAQTAAMARQGRGTTHSASTAQKSEEKAKATRGKEAAKLMRSESSRQQRTKLLAPRIGRELSRQQRHRNSAPSMIFLRSPTPQPQSSSGSAQSLDDRGGSEEQNAGENSIDFGSFLRMPQPYQLKLDKSNQLFVQPSAAHQLAAVSLFRQPKSAWGPGRSLDDSRSDGNLISTASELSNKFFHRQGSVESGGKSAKNGRGGEWEGPRKKLKAGMVGMVGALSALEQNDLDALGAVLSRSRGNDEQCAATAAAEGFRPMEALSTGIYALFSQKITLLDVALMLGRKEAAEMLMEFGAKDDTKVPSVEQRRTAVERVMEQCEGKAVELMSERSGGKDDEKRRLHVLHAQLALLRQMRSHLSTVPVPPLPSPPENVCAECVSPCAALLHLRLSVVDSSVVVRLRVEWSRCPHFSSVDGFLESEDVRSRSLLVNGLSLGHSFAFRVSTASIWGWGPPARADPAMLRISSWDELAHGEDKEENYWDRGRPDSNKLAELVDGVEQYRKSAVWSKVFQNGVGPEREKKRRTGLRHLFSASSKFVKHIQRGLFLTTVFYTEERILCTVDDCLPVICVDECANGVSGDDLHWLMKLSLCWEQLPLLQESLSGSAASSANFQLRSRLLDAALAMHNALGVKDIGRVHHVPLVSQPGTILLVTVRLVPERLSGEAQGLAMRWMRMEKLFRRRQACPTLEFLSRELLPLLNFYESSLVPLEPGLYLAYLRLHSSLNSIHVLVPDNLLSSLPFAKIRPNAHVTCEEWALLKSLAEAEDDDHPKHQMHMGDEWTALFDEQQRCFHNQITQAASRLALDLELDTKQQLIGTRLFRHRLVQLNEGVSLILVMPRAEEVCQMNTAAPNGADIGGGGGSTTATFRGCVSVPVPVFQMINLATYQPEFLSSYCSLSIFLDHFLTMAQYEQRQCLLENDVRMFSEQMVRLGEFQQRLDAIWRSARWISGFASVARDRSANRRNWSLPLMRLLCCSDEWRDRNGSSESRCIGMRSLSPNINAETKAECAAPGTECRSPLLLPVEKGPPAAVRLSHSLNSSPSPCRAVHHPSPLALSPLSSSTHPSHCSASHLSASSSASSTSPVPMPSPASPSAIVRVYASYETGLPQRNISVRLRISGETSAAEVVQLVVRQLAMLSSSGHPSPKAPAASFPSSPNPCQFCLVSVVGARERRLRDEFRVLRLPSPWDKGTLCVRYIHSLGAAIDLANESAV